VVARYSRGDAEQHISIVNMCQVWRKWHMIVLSGCSFWSWHIFWKFRFLPEFILNLPLALLIRAEISPARAIWTRLGCDLDETWVQIVSLTLPFNCLNSPPTHPQIADYYFRCIYAPMCGQWRGDDAHDDAHDASHLLSRFFWPRWRGLAVSQAHPPPPSFCRSSFVGAKF
jgi:hypothetical protein